MKQPLAITQRYGETHLIRDLVLIWGSSLVSAFLPKDFVVDGSNNITSLIARIGPNGANATANRFVLTDMMNRKAMTASNLDEKSITVDVACKTLVVIATAPTLPLTDYSTLARLGASLDEILVGNSGSSLWFLAGEYKDGVSSQAISSGLHIYEASNASSTSVQYRIGGSSIAGRVWQASILGWFGLDTTQTTEQRANSLACINRYLNESQYTTSTQRYGEAQVTADMQAEFGADLVGLWLGRDIVFNGSNIATSWPGRIGSTFTQESLTHNFTKTTYLGRPGLASAPLQSQRFVASTVTARELWVIGSSSSASPTDYQALVTTWDTATGGGSVGRFLQATGNTNQWYSAMDTNRWMDGSPTTTFDTSVHIYGAYIQPVSYRPMDRIILGNDEGAYTTRSWGGNIFGVVALTNQTTTEKRTSGTNYLLRYMSANQNP